MSHVQVGGGQGWVGGYLLRRVGDEAVPLPILTMAQ